MIFKNEEFYKKLNILRIELNYKTLEALLEDMYKTYPKANQVNQNEYKHNSHINIILNKEDYLEFTEEKQIIIEEELTIEDILNKEG